MGNPDSCQRSCSRRSRSSPGVGCKATSWGRTSARNPYIPKCLQTWVLQHSGLRLKLVHSPSGRRCTKQLWGEVRSAARAGVTRVPMRTTGRRMRRTRVSRSCACTRGSSPWTFRTISGRGPSQWARTSAVRAVPLGQSGEVMRTRPPKANTASAMRASSVATTAGRTAETRSQTCWIMGLPAMSAKGLPGSRVLA